MQPRRSLNEMSGRSGIRLRRCRPAVRFTGVSGPESVTSSGDSDLDFLHGTNIEVVEDSYTLNW
jgi:hypothetical protein